MAHTQDAAQPSGQFPEVNRLAQAADEFEKTHRREAQPEDGYLLNEKDAQQAWEKGVNEPLSNAAGFISDKAAEAKEALAGNNNNANQEAGKVRQAAHDATAALQAKATGTLPAEQKSWTESVKETINSVTEGVKQQLAPTAHAMERDARGEAAHQKFEGAKQSAHEGKEELKDAAGQAADAAGHKARQGQHAAGKTADAAQEKTESALEEMKDGLVKAKDTTVDTLKYIGSRFTAPATGDEQADKDAVHNAKAAVDTLHAAPRDDLGPASTDAGRRAAESKEAAKAKAQQTKEDAKQTAAETKEAAKSKAHEAKESAKETAQQTKSWLGAKTDEAEQQAIDAKNKAADKAHEAKESVKETAEKVEDYFTQDIEPKTHEEAVLSEGGIPSNTADVVSGHVDDVRRV